jgi:hypothetical protein
MGTEAFWIPAVLAASGAGVDMYNTKKTADKRDDIALAGLKKQGAHQRDADARITQELNAMEASTPEDERKASLDQYLTQLRSAKASAHGAAGGPGGSRFKDDSRTAKAGIDNFGQRVAGTVSRIGAAGKQRQGERISAGRTAADVGLIGRNSSGDAAVNRMKMDAVQLNPWLQALGIALKAAGVGMGAAGAAGGTGAGGAQFTGATRVLA